MHRTDGFGSYDALYTTTVSNDFASQGDTLLFVAFEFILERMEEVFPSFHF